MAYLSDEEAARAAAKAIAEVTPSMENLQSQITAEAQARQNAVVPMATTTTKGETMFAGDGNSTAGRAVQATDTRLSNARTPTAHQHPISDVTNLQTTLDGKAPVSAVKRIELVTGTWVGNQARVVFTTPFTTPPLVDSSPTWIAQQMIIGQASNITTTGCDVTVMRSKGTLLLTAGPFEAAPTGTAFRMLVFGN